MSKDDGYKIRDQLLPHFLTFTVVHWIDVFTRATYRDEFLECIRYCQSRKGLVVHAWCIMSNHAHFILSSSDGNLSGTIRDLKKYSNYKLLKEVNDCKLESRRDWMLNIFRNAGLRQSRNTHMQFWRHDNCPQELYSYKFIQQKLEYIHQNPVVARIVDDECEYLYSSARDYNGLKGLLEIEFI